MKEILAVLGGIGSMLALAFVFDIVLNDGSATIRIINAIRGRD